MWAKSPAPTPLLGKGSLGKAVGRCGVEPLRLAVPADVGDAGGLADEERCGVKSAFADLDAERIRTGRSTGSASRVG